jgi:hypothetical protein
MVSLAVEDMDFVRVLIGPGDPKVILVATRTSFGRCL